MNRAAICGFLFFVRVLCSIIKDTLSHSETTYLFYKNLLNVINKIRQHDITAVRILKNFRKTENLNKTLTYQYYNKIKFKELLQRNYPEEYTMFKILVPEDDKIQCF